MYSRSVVRFISFLLLFLVLLPLAHRTFTAIAQEQDPSPTEVPVTTPTSAPSPPPDEKSATETPSITPIEPTAVEAPTVTPMPTATPTYTATAPIIEPAETPLPTVAIPSSPAPLIFQDDFQDADLSDWVLSETWVVANENDNLYLSAASPNARAAVANLVWNTALLSVRLKLEADQQLAVTFGSDAEPYTLWLDALGRSQFFQGEIPVAEAAAMLGEPGWYVLKIRVFADAITVAINDEIRLQHTFPAPVAVGAWTFVTSATSSAAAGIDDIYIESLDAFLLTPTSPLPTPTVEAPTLTPTLPLIPTDQPLVPEPPLVLIFSEDFDAELSPDLALGAGWRLDVDETGGYVLLGGEGAEPISYTAEAGLLDAAAEARFLIADGEARLGLRTSAAGSYTAALSAEGVASLYRDMNLMDQVTLETWNEGWHTLRLSVIQNTLRLSVDGIEQIALADFAPLPPGTVEIRADGVALPLRVDNVAIYIPLVETPQPTPTAAPVTVLDASAMIACPPPDQIAMVSVGSNGAQANGSSNSVDISADGRYIVFESDASNLVPNDTNGMVDVFRFDRQTCATVRVSVATGGAESYSGSEPSISADGRYVAFMGSLPGLDGAIFVRDLVNNTTEVVDLADDESPSNGWSEVPAISADGRYVAFRSNADNLVPGDTNGLADVFVRDRLAGTTTRVSLTSSGGQMLANEFEDYSMDIAISDDGRYVAFISNATDLVPDDANYACERDWEEPYDYNENCPDVFLRDTVAGVTTRLSVSTSGTEATRGVNAWQGLGMSGDGRYVVFSSDASNLVTSDTNGASDIFLRDTQLNTTTRVSLTDSGTQANSSSYYPDISDDGDVVVFSSWANNLVSGTTPNQYQYHIYAHRRSTQQTVRLSVSSAGQPGDDYSLYPAISDDGARVAFISEATNLITGDANNFCEMDWVEPYDYDENCQDAFVTRIVFPPPFLAPTNLTATVISGDQVNLTWTDTTTNETAFYIERSPDGSSWWGLGSVAANVTSYQDKSAFCGTPFTYRVRAYRSTDSRFSPYAVPATVTMPACAPQACDPNTNFQRISVGSGNVPQGNGYSANLARGSVISGDGRYTVFFSYANNLVPGDTNGALDVFTYDRETCTTERASLAWDGAQSSGSSDYSSLSADGRYVAFYSSAANLVPGDTNGYPDVFVRDTWTGAVERVSVTDGGGQSNGYSDHPVLSADGRYVAFVTWATNLSSTVTDNNNVCSNIMSSMLLGNLRVYYNFLNCADVYVYDRRDPADINDGGTLYPVSVTAEGTETGDGYSYPHSIVLVDNRPLLAFYSSASNLVTGDTNNLCQMDSDPELESCPDVFLRDVLAGTTTLLSAGGAGQGNGASYNPSLATDGVNLYLTFHSWATNLVTGDTNNTSDIFLRTMPVTTPTIGTVTRLSVSSAGVQANGPSYGPFISADGRYIAFSSHASNLVSGDTNNVCETDYIPPYDYNENCPDVFVRDTRTNTTTRVSVGPGSVQANNSSYLLGIAADGSYVAFYSNASNLVPYDRNLTTDVFIVRVPNTALAGPTALRVASATANQINLAWTDAPGETAYHVERSADGGDWSEIAVLAANRVSYTDLGLACGTPYFYRVRAFNDVTSAFSAYAGPVSGATQTCAPAAAPALVTPAAGAFTNDQTPTFDWGDSANATRYELQWAANSAFTAGLQTAFTAPPITDYTPETDLAPGVYYWRVRAYNNAPAPQPGAWSATRSFTVDITPPAIPVQTAPASGSTSTLARPAFTWGAVAGASAYEVQLGLVNPPFRAPSRITTTSYVPPGPLLVANYYWRVRAVDAAGNIGDWSAVWSVNIESAANATALLYRYATATPTLTWAAVTWAAGYEIQVDDNPAFSELDYRNDQIPASALAETTPPLANGTWYWRVRARKSNGSWGAWSRTTAFTVEA